MSSLPLDPQASARISGLRYVSDQEPGIRRKTAGKGFQYLDPGGRHVSNASILKRIRSLAIPPAWTNVWICSNEAGHLQAVGRDKRGRKQYRYHPLYRAVRDQTKYSRVPEFAKVLPAIRQRVDADLRRPGLSRERILAAIVRLLDSTAIRIGNDEYARANDSFGLTTLRTDHVEVESQKLHFHFIGKSGQEQEITLNDPRMARVVRRLQHLPGQELFLFIGEDGQPSRISSEDVNDYIREIAGDNFTAKDFRTWKGTTGMIAALKTLDPPASENEARHNIVEAVKMTAAKLGNRPAACRAYYIHPAVTQAYLDGAFSKIVEKAESEEEAAVALMNAYPIETPDSTGPRGGNRRSRAAGSRRRTSTSGKAGSASGAAGY